MVKYYKDRPLARLSTDRYDFQDHIDGYSFRQNATTIDLATPITINGNSTLTVEEAIINLDGYITTVTGTPDATASVKGKVKLAGDIGGSAASLSVVGLQGRPVNNTAPSTSQCLGWNGSAWVPQTVATTFTAAGDLAGNASSQTVKGLTGTTDIVAMHGTSILYDDPLGDTLTISVTDSSTLNGSDFNIFSQGTTNSGSRGGGLTLKTGSSSTNKSGLLTLKLGNYNSQASISIGEPTLASRVIGLCLSQSSIDSVLMPAGTGDNVIYIGDATTVPTNNPVDGSVLYSQAGVLKVRQENGDIVIIGNSFTPQTFDMTWDDPGSAQPVTFNITSTASTDGGDFLILGQNTTDASALGGGIELKGGTSTTGKGGYVKISSGNDGYYSLYAKETSTDKYNLGLVINSTEFNQLGAGTGNGVIYIGNATEAPTSGNPTNGFILYAEDGYLKGKQSDGTSFTFGTGLTTSNDSITFIDPGSAGPVTLRIADTALADGGNFEVYGQNTTFASAFGGGVKLAGGDSATGIGGFVGIKSGNSVNYGIMAAETTAGVYNVAIGLNDTEFSNSQLPANSGDGVVYIGNAVTVPTSGSPVNGAIIYSDSGQLKTKLEDGYSYYIGPSPTFKAIDSNDLVVFKLNEAYGDTTIYNSGSGTAFNLNTLTGAGIVQLDIPMPTGHGLLVTEVRYFNGTGGITYQPSVTNMTASCWLQILNDPATGSPGEVSIFGKGNSIDATFKLGYDLEFGNVIFTVCAGGVSADYGNLRLVAGMTYLLAVTYDGANVKTYVNGILLSTNAKTGTLDWDNAYTWIIGNATTTGAVYIVNDCRFSNVARTATEIKTMFKTGMGYR